MLPHVMDQWLVKFRAYAARCSPMCNYFKKGKPAKAPFWLKPARFKVCKQVWENRLTFFHAKALRCFRKECGQCKQRRAERNRLLAPGDASVHEPPFVDAPYVHPTNEPKYVVGNVRAREVAEREQMNFDVRPQRVRVEVVNSV